MVKFKKLISILLSLIFAGIIIASQNSEGSDLYKNVVQKEYALVAQDVLSVRLVVSEKRGSPLYISKEKPGKAD